MIGWLNVGLMVSGPAVLLIENIICINGQGSPTVAFCTSVRQRVQHAWQPKNLKHCLTGKLLQNIADGAYQICQSNHFWYELYLKNCELHLLILSIWLVLVLTIAIRANIVVSPNDNIHRYHRTTVTRNYCAPGLHNCGLWLKYLDAPDGTDWCTVWLFLWKVKRWRCHIMCNAVLLNILWMEKALYKFQLLLLSYTKYHVT